MDGQKWSWFAGIEACEIHHCGCTAADPAANDDATRSPNATVEDKYLNLSARLARPSETAAVDLQCRLKIIIKGCSISSFLLLIY